MSDREAALKALDELHKEFCDVDDDKFHWWYSGKIEEFTEEHRAALAEPEWRDISTAPRDGTPVLVYAPYGGGFITQSYWKAMPNNGHMWVVDCGEICPTHWMPLPSPPKGKTP